MNIFIVLLLIGSFSCFIRAMLLLLSIKQKRAYPPPIVLKQQSFLYGFLAGVALLCILLIQPFL